MTLTREQQTNQDLRSVIFNYAHTFGLAREQVENLAERLNIKEITLNTFSSLRNEIDTLNGGGNNNERVSSVQ